MGFSSIIAKEKTWPSDTNQGVTVNNQWAQRVFDYLTFFPVKQKLILIQPRHVKSRKWGSWAFIPYLWSALLCRGHRLTLFFTTRLLLFTVGTEGNMNPPPQNCGSRTISNPPLWGFTSMGAPGKPTSSSTSQKGTALSSHFHPPFLTTLVLGQSPGPHQHGLSAKAWH